MIVENLGRTSAYRRRALKSSTAVAVVGLGGFSSLITAKGLFYMAKKDA